MPVKLSRSEPLGPESSSVDFEKVYYGSNHTEIKRSQISLLVHPWEGISIPRGIKMLSPSPPELPSQDPTALG